MNGLRQTPLHSALYRPAQLMGCDRTMIILSLGLSAGLFLGCMDMVGAVSGAVFAVLSVYVLRKMAKADPLMRQVYMRQTKYAGYYHPFSRPYGHSKEKGVY